MYDNGFGSSASDLGPKVREGRRFLAVGTNRTINGYLAGLESSGMGVKTMREV